jgi:hypothetical protein
MKDGKGTPKIKTVGGTIHCVVWKGNLLIPFGKNNEIKEKVPYVLDVNSNLLYVEILTNKRLGVFFNLQNVFLLDS